MTATTRLARSLPLLSLVVGLFSSSPLAVSAGFLTNYAVLLNESRGYITNAYGPITAKVSPGAKALTVQFKIVAVPRSYGAGVVTATTNAQGQVTHLAKGAQNCSLAYNATGFVRRVTCSTAPRRRLLGRSPPPESELSEALEFDEVVGYEVAKNGEGGSETGATGGGDPLLVSRQLAACSPCDTLVIGAFSTKIKALCDKAFPAKVPAQYVWARNAAASLCRMTAKLGTPSSVAKKTCRCCTANTQGASGVCSAGVCLSQKIADGRACPDGDSNDCTSGQCGRRTYPNGVYVCCSVFRVLSDTMNDFYCYPQPVGALCDSNFMCAGGVCSLGVCLPQKIADGDPCPDGDPNDCANGRCARSSYPDGAYVCCTGFIAYSPAMNQYYCDSQPDGALCDSYENAMCDSAVCLFGVCVPHKIADGDPCPEGDDFDCVNSKCARNTYPDGNFFCCTSGAYVYSPTLGTKVCTGQGAEARCDDNRMCSSGVCSAGYCLNQTIADGEACPDIDDDDCANSRCGGSTFPDGGFVCCTSGAYLYSIEYDEFYCTGQGAGSLCFSNELCSSGVCSSGLCLSQRLGVNESCPDYEDDDCANRACARISYPYGGPVCCPSGHYAYSFPWDEYYCTGIQGAGMSCESGAICSSGVCSAGVCSA